MDLGPIFRALTRNRARLVLIVAEVALTLAIVVNCLSLIGNAKADLAKESGFDDDNLLVVRSRPFASAFAEDGYLDAAIDRDGELLRAMPGVRQASNTQFRPWIGGGSSWEVKIAGGNDVKFRAQFYFVDPEIIDTLGVKVIEGRNLTREEYETTDLQQARTLNLLISRRLAELIFPGEKAVGKQLTDPDETAIATIVGVFDPFYNPYGWPIHEYATLVPGRNGSRIGWSYLVRADPGQRDPVAGEIERALLAANDGRNVEVRSIEEIRATYESTDRALVAVLNAVMALLVVVTALGILGITSFAVAERQRQIGTRRALGATRGAILRHFLFENWLVTTLGVVLGIALAFGLNVGLVNVVEGARLNLGVVAAGAVLLWLIGQLATLGPALRAAQVPPAVATRSV